MRLTVARGVGLVVAAAFLTLLGVNLFVGNEARIVRPVRHEYPVSDPQFTRTLGALLGPPLIGGNRVDTLLNGDEIFPPMLQAIAAARRSIDFETYIYWSGDVGKRFADALSERARAGVKVHILVDWVGSQKMEASLLQQMRDAGAEIVKYHPLHWYTLDRLNNRTHRKLLVVDGRVGFTGGVGIADEWSGHAQDPQHWRDTHFRIEGPAVAQMQAAFTDNWTKVSGVVLHDADYFPEPAEAGAMRAQVFRSSPDGGADSMHFMYLLSIASATRSIDLSMAYFVPDDIAQGAILDALRRGVRVRILLPGEHTDAGAVRRASRALWGPILRAGAEIHEYRPTMFHCKVLVVDGRWVSVGSTNFDTRSFRLNDEANLNVYDAGFAARQEAIFEDDLRRGRRISYEEWASRPWTEKAWEHVLALLGPQL
jgi:cardiolipin synthase